MKTTTRKKRNDRTHAIYMLSVGDKCYIGITARTQSTVLKSVAHRFRKHVNRALSEDKSWPLCVAIRKYGAEAFTVEILETVRGKALAHQRERELIREYNPKLNLA